MARQVISFFSPLGGIWTPGEYVILSQYMKLLNANYQICGLVAFNHYGLDEQNSNMVMVNKDKKSEKRTITSSRFEFVKVPQERLVGCIEIKLSDPADSIIMSTLARCLMDGVYDWYRYNTLPRAYKWIIQIKKK